MGRSFLLKLFLPTGHWLSVRYTTLEPDRWAPWWLTVSFPFHRRYYTTSPSPWFPLAQDNSMVMDGWRKLTSRRIPPRGHVARARRSRPRRRWLRLVRRDGLGESAGSFMSYETTTPANVVLRNYYEVPFSSDPRGLIFPVLSLSLSLLKS